MRIMLEPMDKPIKKRERRLTLAFACFHPDDGNGKLESQISVRRPNPRNNFSHFCDKTIDSKTALALGIFDW